MGYPHLWKPRYSLCKSSAFHWAPLLTSIGTCHSRGACRLCSNRSNLAQMEKCHDNHRPIIYPSSTHHLPIIYPQIFYPAFNFLLMSESIGRASMARHTHQLLAVSVTGLKSSWRIEDQDSAERSGCCISHTEITDIILTDITSSRIKAFLRTTAV